MKKNLLLLSLLLALWACSPQPPPPEETPPAPPAAEAKGSVETARATDGKKAEEDAGTWGQEGEPEWLSKKQAPAPGAPAATVATQGLKRTPPHVVPPTPRTTKADYYVAPNGNDNHPGTIEKPFLTIQKAASVAKAGQVVAVRAGVYRESVRPASSGTAGNPIIFTSYGDEIAVISGADVVSGFRKSSGQIHSARWAKPFRSENNQAMQLYVNGQAMNEARFPNTGLDLSRPVFLLVDKVVEKKVLKKVTDRNVTARITIQSKGFTEPAGKWDGAQIDIRPMWEWGWGMSRTGTIVSSKPGEITFDFPNYEMGKGSTGTIIRDNSPTGENCPFFVFGKAVGVDHPGEWFFDEKAQTIGLYPPEGVALDKALVEVKMRDWAFDLSERSHIVIRGFHLFASTITTDTKSGTGIPEFEINKEVRTSSLAAASHILIDGIHARYVTHYTNKEGYVLSQWMNNTGIVLSGSEITLQNSTIGYSAGNGVSVLGRRNKVLNNIIFSTGYSGSEVGAVATGTFRTESYDHEIAYNTMYTMGGNGSYPSNMASSDSSKPASMHHNLLNNTGLIRMDVGFIYTSGGRNGSIRSFHHNIMFGNTTFQGFGIYHDYGNEWHNYNNVVFDVAWATCLHSNDQGGLNRLYYNNVLWGLGHSVNAQPGPGHRIYVRNNIMNGEIKAPPAKTVFENNLEFNDYRKLEAIFEDPFELDFRVKAGVEGVVDAGQALPPFTDGFKGKAPDLGAVEVGAPMFWAGATIQPVVAAPTSLKARRTGTSITLNWKDNADNEAYYIIERSTHIDTGYIFNVKWETLAKVPANTTEFVDTKPNGARVYYRVYAPESMTTNIAMVVE